MGGAARPLPAVRRVADDRVADRAEVHANLVRASGMDRDLAQRDAPQVPGPRDARHRMPRTPGTRRHLLTVFWIAADGQVDPPPRLHDAPHERRVFLLDLTFRDLSRELVVSLVVL